MYALHQYRHIGAPRSKHATRSDSRRETALCAIAEPQIEKPPSGNLQGDSEAEKRGLSQDFRVSFANSGSVVEPTAWSFRLRAVATINVSLIGWITTVASSIDAAALMPASQDFQVSTKIESLATALFLVGLAFGVLSAGPLSEEYGRNAVYVATMALFMLFTVASALASSIHSQLVFRTAAGYFAAAPLCCAGGSVCDLWTHTERAWAFPAFAVLAFTGPIFGPIIGGYIAESESLSWRWCEWITLILSAAILLSVLLFQPETHPPTLLRWRARCLRTTTGDARYWAEVDLTATTTFRQRLSTALYRPFTLLFHEPLVMLLGTYLTIIYVVIFLFFQGYDYIFGDMYDFSQGLIGLSFLGTALGIVLTAFLIPPIYKKYKADLTTALTTGDSGLPPERRLRFALYGAPFLPISILWIGFTSSPSVSYWSPLVASIFLGFSTLCIYMSCYQYLMDAYGPLAASALASVTFVRYLASAGMYVAAGPILESIGVKWTCAILGGVSALMTPLPYLLRRYGKAVRQTSARASDV